MKTVAVFLLICIIIFEIASVLYVMTKGWFLPKIFHDKLGWHVPSDEQHDDGYIVESTCRICGKKITTDSQDNWW